jgi:hypothetical protein
MFTNIPEFNSDFHTLEFAVNRRFNDRWMALTSFESGLFQLPTAHFRLTRSAAGQNEYSTPNRATRGGRISLIAW